jgi:hypothetical protein
MAADLNQSLSAVGLLVTGYGLTVAVVSVPLTRLTARMPRRVLLPALLSVFVITTWTSVVAADYWLLLGSRIVMALSQAIFWPVAVVAAAGLFSPRVRGRAATVVFAGGSLAVVLGVPAGTWLGQQTGWRASFLALSGLGVLALFALIALLPAGAPGAAHTAAADTPDARRYRLLVVTTALAVTGFFTVFTYIVVHLHRRLPHRGERLPRLRDQPTPPDVRSGGLRRLDGCRRRRGPRPAQHNDRVDRTARGRLPRPVRLRHRTSRGDRLARPDVGGAPRHGRRAAGAGAAGRAGQHRNRLGGHLGRVQRRHRRRCPHLGGLLLPTTGIRGTALAAALLTAAALAAALAERTNLTSR